MLADVWCSFVGINDQFAPSQVIFQTKPCPPLASFHGSKGSSAMPITPVSNTQPVGSLQAWCPTTTTQCELICFMCKWCRCIAPIHTHPSLFRLARFWMDAQELLFEDTEFLQLGRLWRELMAMSNFMDTLRTNPELIAGQLTSRHLGFPAIPSLFAPLSQITSHAQSA